MIELCQGYVGQTVSPLSFAAAIAPISKLAPKGEFETTAQFQSRRTQALSSLPQTLVISKAPEDAKFFVYDADNQKLQIIRFAFSNQPFRLSRAFNAAGLYENIDVSTTDNIVAVISQVDVPTGTYAATNGYGATTDVLKVRRKSEVIFERRAEDWRHSGLFESADNPPYVTGELIMPPAEARRLKPSLKLAFVVSPKEPYVVTGTHNPYNTTLQDPREISEEFTILVADFRCGLVIDAASKVLGGFPTR